MELALASPEKFVLKPQREGGGEYCLITLVFLLATACHFVHQLLDPMTNIRFLPFAFIRFGFFFFFALPEEDIS